MARPPVAIAARGFEPSCIAAIIRHHAAARPQALALRCEDRDITWTALQARGAQIGQALARAGVARQERIAFLDKNGAACFEVLTGAAQANAVVVAVNWRLASAELTYTINDARPRVLIVGSEFFPVVEQIEPQLETITSIIALGSHPRWRAYEDWIAAEPAVDRAVPTAPEDVCLQLYTSGTTGLPKGVMITNANFTPLLSNVTRLWSFDAASVNLVCMPLFHMGGCGWALVGMLAGAVSVVVREFRPLENLDLMQNEGVTNSLFVPAMLGFMAQVPGAEVKKFPALRSIVYAGSPIANETLLAAMRVFKSDFVQVYGMTETSGAITELAAADHDPSGNRAHLLRSAGKPYQWVELRIVDVESGQEAPTGKVGEVWTRSSQNMAGYWGKSEETARTLVPDGWLRTGDAGYLDAEGYLFLTDRVKDMIVSGGENVYPAEVENVLASHAAIAEVAVIGMPDPRWGETVKAVVVLKVGSNAVVSDIIAFAKARLAHYKCPTSVDFVTVLPRNPPGKVLKKDLRAPYWAGRERAIN